VRSNVAADRTERTEVLHRSQVLAPLHEVVQRPPLLVIDVDVPVFDGDHAIAFSKGKGSVNEGVREREETQANRDCRGEAEAADERQPRIFHEHPRPELEVDARIVDPAERPRVALTLLGLLDAAKRALRRESRFFRAHPFGEESIFEEPQMRADLARQLVFGSSGSKRRPQAPEKSSESIHHGAV